MNSVSAMVTGERPLSSVRTRRTVVTFDSMGGIRIGGIPQLDMAVTDFADLAHDPESVVVGGRFWSPANLVAAVVNGLRESFPPTTGAVVTYPACYSDKQLSLLRQALNLAGAREVLLIPEPVAAAEWLEQERGPLESGFVLVYDLGGASLDVSMVRVGPDWDDHPIVGKSVRSYDFGGRPLGSMIARYARVAEPGDNGSMLQMTSIVDITSMRAQHIRDSLDVVHECVASTGRKLSDVAYILLVGGATRPVEVARVLADLGRPVVMSADPGQTIAVGAANYAARSSAPLSTGGRHRAPKVAVFSSAAVASAVAVSAVTVFGGPTIPSRPSLVEASPDGFPMDNRLFEPHVEALAEAGSATANWATTVAGFGYSGRAPYRIAPVVYTSPTEPAIGPSVAEAHGGRHSEPRGGTSQSGGTYANPAQFLNPLPFLRTPQPIPAAPNQPATGTPIPSVNLHGSVPTIPGGAGSNPGGAGSNPGGAGSNPGGAGSNPGGAGSNPGGAGSNPGGAATNPGGAATNPGGAATNPGGAGSNPGGAGSNPGGAATNPGGGASTPGGSATNPGGTVMHPGGTATPRTGIPGTDGTSTVDSAPGRGETSTGTVAPGGTASNASGSGSRRGDASGDTASGHSSGGSWGGTSGGSTNAGTSGGSTGGGMPGRSAGGGTSGGSVGVARSGGATGSGAAGSTGGGASRGSTNGRVSGGSTGGSTSGSIGGGMPGGSTGGSTHSGGSTGGSTHSGGISSGGGFSHGSGGLGAGGGARR
ncbi:Hsp70 family protein [Nocardia sp. R16R-3T]